MARFSITVARKHGETSFKAISGPEVPIDAQKAACREMAGSREHPEFAEVKYLESDAGVLRSYRFREPAPADPEDGDKSGAKAKGKSAKTPK